MIGEHEKSIQYYERAMQLSPLDTSSFESYAGISFPYFFLGRYGQAFHWAERALRQRPRFIIALMSKVAALAMEGSQPDKVGDAVQQVKSFTHPLVSISAIMLRFPPSQPAADRERFETALRKAGFPE